jgi:hypothetical protein
VPAAWRGCKTAPAVLLCAQGTEIAQEEQGVHQEPTRGSWGLWARGQGAMLLSRSAIAVPMMMPDELKAASTDASPCSRVMIDDATALLVHATAALR